eukprot:TRINITY_DN28917_c0_g1_i1.p1 TRINITY_DN28917_c0_g1~~TRINITY_DN28917_c0_g1_i1.p1  ORF type:complete len:117 (+),score=24.45 TRINITY_DN28917_c0_g1_i1:309-659(+)
MEEGVESSESRATENSIAKESERTAAFDSDADTDVRSRYRRLAELQKLNQEIQYLEEEIEGLDKLDRATSACKEMLILVDSRPDPLLPITKGPVNSAWDRWFEGPVEVNGCKCWIS